MKYILLIILSFFQVAYAQTILDAFKPRILTNVPALDNVRYFGNKIEGQNVIVSVIDSGVNILHPHFADRIVKGGYNYYHKNELVIDDNGHGTHVTGTIIGDRFGIAPKAKVLPIKVTTTPEGAVDSFYLYQAIKHASDKGAKIINLSLGGLYYDMPVTQGVIKDAIRYAKNKGVLVVVAAGNDALDITNLPYYPAIIDEENVITVCAVDDYFNLAYFSNFSKTKVDLCAPGVDIASSEKSFNPFVDKKAYTFMSGTSMATPIVSGVAALLKSIDPNLKPKEIKEILINSASKKYYLINASQSSGVVNAKEAVCTLLEKKGFKCP